MDTERITFSDGSWWEVRTLVTRGMRKAFRAAGMRAFLSGLNGGLIDADPESLKRAVLAHPGQWDLDAVDDAFLLHGTAAWSWPEPVTQEAIDQRPDTIVSCVLERLKVFYAEPGVETLKN